MKLIHEYAEIISQKYDRLGIYEAIELAGRTSYKSEHRIELDENGRSKTAEAFTKKLESLHHGAALEHGTVYLTIPSTEKMYSKMVECYKKNPYSCVIEHDGNAYVTTNYRVIVENVWTYDLKYLTTPHNLHKKRISVRFVISRAIANEFVRHRVFSFLQESTRYVNYKNGVEFIYPVDWDKFTSEQKGEYKTALNDAEDAYGRFLSLGMKPERARDLLPLCTKTELVMTGFEDDWNKFFALRTAKGAHPDAQAIAKSLMTTILAEQCGTGLNDSTQTK